MKEEVIRIERYEPCHRKEWDEFVETAKTKSAKVNITPPKAPVFDTLFITSIVCSIVSNLSVLPNAQTDKKPFLLPE